MSAVSQLYLELFGRPTRSWVGRVHRQAFLHAQPPPQGPKDPEAAPVRGVRPINGIGRMLAIMEEEFEQGRGVLERPGRFECASQRCGLRGRPILDVRQAVASVRISGGEV